MLATVNGAIRDQNSLVKSETIFDIRMNQTRTYRAARTGGGFGFNMKYSELCEKTTRCYRKVHKIQLGLMYKEEKIAILTERNEIRKKDTI